MSEMGESSVGSGGTDAPDTGQSPAANDPDQPVLQMASAPAGDSPPPPAGVLKPAEAGKASAPASIDAPPAAGALKQPEPGRATALAGDSPPPAAASAPKPPEPGRASAPDGNSTHFDVATALWNAEKQLTDARHGRDGRPPGMLHEAWEQWLRGAKTDAKLAEPGKASAPASRPKPGGEGNPEERPSGEGLNLDYLLTDVAFPRKKRRNQAGDDS
jgi:hypothetical protein